MPLLSGTACERKARGPDVFEPLSWVGAMLRGKGIELDKQPHVLPLRNSHPP
jgi:hypothetical protein